MAVKCSTDNQGVLGKMVGDDGIFMVLRGGLWADG